MIALIDADIVAYRCAASCKGEDGPEIANLRADRLMRQILDRTGAEKFRAFLSGSRNWRKDLYPEYKANRKQPSPTHLYSCKEFLVHDWNAIISDGIEADDDIGIAWAEAPDDSIICSIDKDFKQLGGKFYDFVLDKEFSVDKFEALRYFYKQTLLGDKSDNIPGYDGKARQKPTNYIQDLYNSLDELEEAADMYDLCLSAYEEAERTVDDLLLSGKLLYIWRTNPDEWHPPK